MSSMNDLKLDEPEEEDLMEPKTKNYLEDIICCLKLRKKKDKDEDENSEGASDNGRKNKPVVYLDEEEEL